MRGAMMVLVMMIGRPIVEYLGRGGWSVGMNDDHDLSYGIGLGGVGFLVCDMSDGVG